ncbi:MAG TPA: hypothetical protein VGZ22_04885 [Isosphaeraceae bacterium]|jgi:hypothetical protein|nr:hypothetical protein [Isosphaeraceae bacterium]
MNESITSIGVPAAPRWRPRGIVGFLYTSNPFYVLSACLVFVGLRMSFHPSDRSADIRILMFCLAGYTLLLATTAWLLIRFGRVWQDVRTILLLVVLMFLATSVTIDDTLICRPNLGRACFVGAFVFAAAVSEGVLRGIRLRLPTGFRVPYYLILGLFFLYPVALSPWINQPESAEMHWGLFAFSPLAGLLFLTLLPAVRRGRWYVANNGSPWPWPLYPWVLFGVLALGVCGRSYYLCVSLHNVPAFQTIFGPYFLVPFLLAMNVLALEAGLVSRRPRTVRMELIIPFGLALLSAVGHRNELVYQHFLEMVRFDLGGSPLFLTLVAVAAFNVYAIARRVPNAAEALTAALAALVVVGPSTLGPGTLIAPRAAMLVAIGLIQFGFWLESRASWRVLVACGCWAAAAMTALGDVTILTGQARVIIAFHAALCVVLLVGALCDDVFGRFLRHAGAVLIAYAGVSAVVDPSWVAVVLPGGMVPMYPLLLALTALGYANLIGHRPSLCTSALCLAAWMVGQAWKDYVSLRRLVTGLDEIVLGLLFFAVAALISLAKSGLLTKWLAKMQATNLPRSPD